MNDLWKIKATNATVILLCSFSVFTVALAIFLLSRPLFFELNLWQALAICIGIAGSILGTNYLLASGLLDEPVRSSTGTANEAQEEKEASCWGLAGLLTLMALNLSLVYTFLFSSSLKMMFFNTVVTDVALFSILAWIKHRNTNRAIEELSREIERKLAKSKESQP